MPDASQRQADVRAKLRAAGYSLIQFEPAVGATGDFRPDVVAFASDSNGRLIPRVAIEITSGVTKKRPEFVLPALARDRELLGTTEHYAVIDGRWYRADRGLRSLERVDGPAPLDDEASGGGLVTDLSLATSLQLDRLREEGSSRRGQDPAADFAFPSGENLIDIALAGIETAGGDFVPVEPSVLWKARRRALVAFAGGSRRTSANTSDSLIAESVARLLGARLGGVVLDPFCGTGSFLWAAMDLAMQLDSPVEFVGVEIEPALAELAGQVARSAPMLATVTVGNAFEEQLPQAHAVVSAPPVGMRVQGERRPLLSGGAATGVDLAALDLCVRRLAPSGRAVVHLPLGITFKGGVYERYRTFLAHEFRVAALIGLPPGAMEGTQLRSVVLVVDRDRPGKTFVAQLGPDWRTQLSEHGAAMLAALDHLDGLSET